MGMGVRRLFQGRTKISKGALTYFLPKNNKNTIFSQKSLKPYNFRPAFAGQRGGGKSPLPDAHANGFNFFQYMKMIKLSLRESVI